MPQECNIISMSQRAKQGLKKFNIAVVELSEWQWKIPYHQSHSTNMSSGRKMRHFPFPNIWFLSRKNQAFPPIIYICTLLEFDLQNVRIGLVFGPKCDVEQAWCQKGDINFKFGNGKIGLEMCRTPDIRWMIMKIYLFCLSLSFKLSLKFFKNLSGRNQASGQNWEIICPGQWALQISKICLEL